MNLQPKFAWGKRVKLNSDAAKHRIVDMENWVGIIRDIVSIGPDWIGVQWPGKNELWSEHKSDLIVWSD